MTDWAPGDYALCIREGSWLAFGVGPQRGEVHRAIAVLEEADIELLAGPPEVNPCFLEFARWPGNTFGSRNFLKVTPPEEMAGDELEKQIVNAEPLSPADPYVVIAKALARQMQGDD